jgi:hypothetical protein
MTVYESSKATRRRAAYIAGSRIKPDMTVYRIQQSRASKGWLPRRIADLKVKFNRHNWAKFKKLKRYPSPNFT